MYIIIFEKFIYREKRDMKLAAREAQRYQLNLISIYKERGYICTWPASRL